MNEEKWYPPYLFIQILGEMKSAVSTALRNDMSEGAMDGRTVSAFETLEMALQQVSDLFIRDDEGEWVVLRADED